MINEMFFREAEEDDIMGLFLLYVPVENYFFENKIPMGEAQIKSMLKTSLSHPDYHFFVVEYCLEIVAAYGIRNSAPDDNFNCGPVISDLKIAEEVQNILTVNEIIEDAILQGRLAGFNQVTIDARQLPFAA